MVPRFAHGDCRAANTAPWLGMVLALEAAHDRSELIEDAGMNTAARTRMQIRVVMTVFRSEMARLARLYPADRGAAAGALLQARSVEMLDSAKARLNGESAANPDLVAELESARQELDRGTSQKLSAGLSGDRRG